MHTRGSSPVEAPVLDSCPLCASAFVGPGRSLFLVSLHFSRLWRVLFLLGPRLSLVNDLKFLFFLSALLWCSCFKGIMGGRSPSFMFSL